MASILRGGLPMTEKFFLRINHLVEISPGPSFSKRGINLAQRPSASPFYQRGIEGDFDHPLISLAASSTACKIFVYPVQRQRFPDSAWRISSRVGCGFSSNKALAVRRIPGMQ